MMEKQLAEAWSVVQDRLFCHELPFPRLDDQDHTALIDMSTHQIRVSMPFIDMLRTKGVEPAQSLVGILSHEAGHYKIIPWDLKNMRYLEAVASAECTNSREVTNFFMDACLNLELILHKDIGEIALIYHALDKSSRIDNLMCALYQEKTGIDFGAHKLSDDDFWRLEKLMALRFTELENSASNLARYAQIVKDMIEPGKKVMDCFESLDVGQQIVRASSSGVDLKDLMRMYSNLADSLLPVVREHSDDELLSAWELDCEFSNVDVFNSYARFIPGVSKVWKQVSVEQTLPDLLVVLDSSGSMVDPSKQISHAVLGAVACAKYYFRQAREVGLINFSDRTVFSGYVRDERMLLENALLYQDGSTRLDALELRKALRPCVDVLLITDGEIENASEVEQCFSKFRGRVTYIQVGSCNLDLGPRAVRYKVSSAAQIPGIIIGGVV